jgi:hypothetical protein
MMQKHVHHVFWLLALLCLLSSRGLAASVTFTVTASEPVTVTGTPRIAINVGGVTRYANYVSTSGSAMTFAYQVQAGDFDADGISIDAPQIDLNGATITDLAGNPLSSLSFTAPNTSNLKVQTYTAAFVTSPITSANAGSISFTISKAPTGASFAYTISSSNDSLTISGTGTISGMNHTVSGVDISGLAAGIITVSVTVSVNGKTGTARSATTTPALTGPIDGVPGTLAAYSTYRLRGTYLGPLVRVRRSSDNAERDIGAIWGGSLDTSTLSSFCPSPSSCFVSTWYDQSGNARDASQSDPVQQPRLTSAGTVDQVNGVPALFFDGSDPRLLTSIAIPASVDSIWSTHLARVLGDGGGNLGRIWGMSVNPSLSTVRYLNYYYGTANFIGSSAVANPQILSIAFRNGTGGIFVNGQSTVTGNGGFTGGEALVIGNLGSLPRAFHGNLQTLVVGWGAYSTTDRQAIERWLGALSGITVQ